MLAACADRKPSLAEQARGRAERAPEAEAAVHRAEAAMHARALDEHDPTERGVLADLVGARCWGPGCFGAALRETVADGRAERRSRTLYGRSSRPRD